MAIPGSMVTIHLSASISPSRFAAIRRRVWDQMFGQLIQGARETGGRSIEETARLAGMEVSEWEAIEAGYVPTDTGRLRSMAGALEMDWNRMTSLALFCRHPGTYSGAPVIILARVLIKRYAHFLRGR